MPKDKDQDARKIVATNRRAFNRYDIVDTLEAGIALTGPEVKSVRAGGVNMQDAFARIDREEAFLWNLHIAPYAQGSLHVEQNPVRTRKLLLNRSEINRWMGRMTARGLTIVPLEMYFNKRGVAKVKLALAKGRKGPDRREEIRRRTVGREIEREYAGRHKIK